MHPGLFVGGLQALEVTVLHPVTLCNSLLEVAQEPPPCTLAPSRMSSILQLQCGKINNVQRQLAIGHNDERAVRCMDGLQPPQRCLLRSV